MEGAAVAVGLPVCWRPASRLKVLADSLWGSALASVTAGKAEAGAVPAPAEICCKQAVALDSGPSATMTQLKRKKGLGHVRSEEKRPDPDKILSFRMTKALRCFLAAQPNTLTGRRDTLILTMLFDTGMRAYELVCLRVGDVNLRSETPHVLVHGKDREKPIVTVTGKTAVLLRGCLGEFHGEVPDPDRRQFSRGSAASAEACRSGRWSASRASTATPSARLARAFQRKSRRTCFGARGTPPQPGRCAVEMIAVLLGHASVPTTMDHYATASLEQEKHHGTGRCRSRHWRGGYPRMAEDNGVDMRIGMIPEKVARIFGGEKPASRVLIRSTRELCE